MKKTKTEIALIWDEITLIWDEIALIWDAIHDILVREHSTNTKLDSQIEDLNDEVINLIKSDAVKDDQIDDHERRIKTVDDRRIEAVVRADKQDEIIGRLLTDMSSLATDYMDLRTLVDSHTNLHAMDNDLFKAQSNVIEDLRATVAGMGNLATVHRDLSIKLGDMAKTVDSLVADSEALMLDSAYLYRREKELQTQVDELQTKVNDQAEALEHLSTGMENVAKVLTNFDGWMTNVETVLSALRKSA